jgi:type I restriction enzyme S subunit
MTAIHVSDSEDRVSELAIGHGTRLAPAGSVLVMVRGMGLHQGVRISLATRDVTFNQDVKALVPRGLSSTHLLFALLDLSPYLFAAVESSGHGTGKIPTDKLDVITFCLPEDDGVRSQLSAFIDPMNDKIASNDREISTLAALRDSLLPKLISGDLRLQDAETFLERVL